MLARCLALLALAFAFSSSRAQDPLSDENLVWTAPRAEAITLILSTARGFDRLFANAAQSDVTPDTVEIVLRNEAYTDKDGKSYHPSILIVEQEGTVVLTLLDLAAGTPDLSVDNLETRLFRAIIKALDAKFKRVQPEG
jgi:hypothetical protein